MRFFNCLLVSSLLVPLVGCQSESARIRFQVASDVNAPDASPGTLPRALEVAVVTVTKADLKKPGNEVLDPSSPRIDSSQWFQAASGGGSMYQIPPGQVHYLSDEDRTNGTKLGRWLVWRPNEENAYEYTIPLPDNTRGILVFARFLDSQNNIRRTPPLALKVKNSGATAKGKVEGPFRVRVGRDSLTRE